jgi:hypothetical protein
MNLRRRRATSSVTNIGRVAVRRTSGTETTERSEDAMAKYQKQFELDVKDMDLIEEALNRRVGELAQDLVFTADQTGDAGSRHGEIGAIRELLGRLHNQKIWYEPESFVPRG